MVSLSTVDLLSDTTALEAEIARIPLATDAKHGKEDEWLCHQWRLSSIVCALASR